MIPEKFTEMMKPVLGTDFEKFINALENSPAVRALRVNTLKIPAEDFLRLAPFSVRECAIPEGFVFDEEKVGGDPLHHAGAYYVQDPSAMATVTAASPYIPGGSLMLDLCAAPGGKSTQLASLDPAGFLVSNEIVPSRARILRGNIERMGVKNAAVTSCDTAVLAKEYPEVFDVVLCDAPCSGEGMMRKYNAEVLENWSEENVRLCAARQKEILENAAECTAPGGVLIYSTCTFNLFENEMTVDDFLSRHGDFYITDADERIKKITADGIDFEGCTHEMGKCRRFYPHLTAGEGQFICVMKRKGEREERPRKLPVTLKKDEEKIAEDFFRDVMGGVPEGYSLCKIKDTVMLCPENALCPGGATVCGTAAGEVVKGRFEPHHHLFSAFGGDFKRRVELSADLPETEKYLRGETIPYQTYFPDHAKNGWCAVLMDGCPVGGGKIVDGTVKNHYPKGLRLVR